MVIVNHRFKILCAMVALLILVALASRFLDRPTAPVVVETGMDSDGVGDSIPVREDDGRENPCHPTQVALSPPETPEPEDETKAVARALSGVVTDRKGWPIAEVGIYARHEDEAPVATTDGGGWFAIEHLAHYAKNRPIYVRHPDYLDKSAAIDTALKTGETLAITLIKGATLTGMVTSGGRPVANQEVKVVRAGLFGPSYTGNTRTDAHGAYEFTTVELGPFKATSFLRPDDDESTPRSMSIDLVLKDEQTRLVDFDFRDWDATLEGQILFNGDPAPNTSISVTSRTLSEAKESLSENTDSEGFYRFEALPSGVLEVGIEVEAGATEHMRASTIELPAGFVSTRDFSLGGTGVITGYCTGREDYRHSMVMLMPSKFSDLFEEQGVYRTFAMLEVENPFVAGITVLSDDGSFRLEGLEAGAYAMLTLVNVGLSGSVDYAFTPVTVSESQETHVVFGPEYLTEYEPEED